MQYLQSCENKFYIYCLPEMLWDTKFKPLYIYNPCPNVKISSVASILTESNSLKWTFKTVAQLEKEKLIRGAQ